MTVPLRSYLTGGRAVDISAGIESAIRDGELQPGTQVPTVRGLAAELGVSTTTVASAYRDLQARGFLTGAGRHGTIVRPRPPVASGARTAVQPGMRDLTTGNPDPALLPDLGPALAGAARGRVLYGAPTAEPALLEVARAAFAADGIEASQLAVVGGALDGVERVLQAHLHPGDRVAVEDPSYPAVLDLLGALGIRAESVAVDDLGMLPAELERALGRGVRAVVITPRCQNPYGAALNAQRARELTELVDRHPEVLVIEDDHAGPVAGVPALTTGSRASWAVIRSVSKALGPDLRLAVLAGDPVTVGRVEGRRLLGTGWTSHILQRASATLLAEPAIRRALASAAEVYGQRREALLTALRDRGIEAHGRSGFNVWIPVAHEDSTVRELAARGWAVVAGERFRLRTSRAVRVTITTLEPREAPGLAADLAAAVGAGTSRIG